MKSLILLALVFASCKHLPEITEGDTLGTSFCTFPAGDSLCDDDWVPPVEATYYGPHMFDGIHFLSPSVNPNNSNQFVCFKKNTLFPPKTDIIVYDMQTDEERILFSYPEAIIGSLEWGRKNWIAFTSGPGRIRIFKSDGSNERQIVASSPMYLGGGGAGPTWSPDGNYLYYYTSNYVGITCDTMGNTIANHEIINKPSWNDNNIVIGGGGRIIHMLDLNTNLRRTLTTLPNDQIQSIEWLPDNRHALFSLVQGVFRVDTHTGEIVLFKDRCDMKWYPILSISSKDNSILCEKRVSKKPNPQSLIYRHEIWKMDINGCNEVRVLPKE